MWKTSRTPTSVKPSLIYTHRQVSVSVVSPHLPDHLCTGNRWLRHPPVSVQWAGPAAPSGPRRHHGVWSGADILWCLLWGHGQGLCSAVCGLHVCWDDCESHELKSSLILPTLPSSPCSLPLNLPPIPHLLISCSASYRFSCCVPPS